jgi:hypothetical protein
MLEAPQQEAAGDWHGLMSDAEPAAQQKFRRPIQDHVVFYPHACPAQLGSPGEYGAQGSNRPGVST